jgi:oligoribonuclease (3'-5' exoribonuclease)|nr:MAG: hypothetical protein [Caudoviricetes sp.]
MDKEYNHYYKKVPYEYIDVYRVLELFEVVDPAIQHAVKKLLVAGNRGHKDLQKDVKEAIVSLNRRIEMWEEETESLSVVSTSAYKSVGR